MNSNSRGQNRRIDLVFRPRARTVQPSFFDDPYYDPLSDDDLAAAAAAAVFGDDDDCVVAAPAHGSSSSSKRPHVAAASEEAILRLPEVTGRSRLGSGEECAVCWQDFRADETLRAMPCSHAFHQHCISEWLRRNAVCPLCRCRLPDEEEDKQRRKIDL